LCQDNNLSLNVSKTKELIVDYRKCRAEHAPFHIDEAVVELQVPWCPYCKENNMIDTQQHSREEGTTTPLA
jgi:hypothetical protein